MSLTADDLGKIQQVMKAELGSFRVEFKAELKAELKVDLDRMEDRIVTALGFVERDHDSRIGELERRVGRLEQSASVH